MKFVSYPTSSSISFRNGDDGKGNIKLPSVTICPYDFREVSGGEFNSLNKHCSPQPGKFSEVYYLCYDKHYYEKLSSTTTTTESYDLFGNMFDDEDEWLGKEDKEPQKPFTTIPELMNGTLIPIYDMLFEYNVGTSYSVNRNVMTSKDAHKILETDWKMTIDHEKGACYTLDHSLLNYSYVPQTYYRWPEGNILIDIQLYLTVI